MPLLNSIRSAYDKADIAGVVGASVLDPANFKRRGTNGMRALRTLQAGRPARAVPSLVGLMRSSADVVRQSSARIAYFGGELLEGNSTGFLPAELLFGRSHARSSAQLAAATTSPARAAILAPVDLLQHGLLGALLEVAPASLAAQLERRQYAKLATACMLAAVVGRVALVLPRLVSTGAEWALVGFAALGLVVLCLAAEGSLGFVQAVARLQRHARGVPAGEFEAALARGMNCIRRQPEGLTKEPSSSANRRPPGAATSPVAGGRTRTPLPTEQLGATSLVVNQAYRLMERFGAVDGTGTDDLGLLQGLLAEAADELRAYCRNLQDPRPLRVGLRLLKNFVDPVWGRNQVQFNPPELARVENLVHRGGRNVVRGVGGSAGEAEQGPLASSPARAGPPGHAPAVSPPSAELPVEVPVAGPSRRGSTRHVAAPRFAGYHANEAARLHVTPQLQKFAELGAQDVTQVRAVAQEIATSLRDFCRDLPNDEALRYGLRLLKDNVDQLWDEHRVAFHPPELAGRDLRAS